MLDRFACLGRLTRRAFVASALLGGLLTATLAVQAVPAQAQDFMIRHQERLNRLVDWSKRNPLLDVGVTPIIVRREHLRASPGYDPIVTRVIFYNRVFFGFDRSSLDDRGEEVVRSFAALLRAEPTAPALLIAGHTDSLGPEAYNAKLSEQRAIAVAYRLNDMGIPLESMRLIAMGEIQPLLSNREPNSQANNRRVEFFISNSEEANEVAARLVRFDPCHRNDHPGAKPEEKCHAGQTLVSIEELRPDRSTRDSGRYLQLQQ